MEGNPLQSKISLLSLHVSGTVGERMFRSSPPFRSVSLYLWQSEIQLSFVVLPRSSVDAVPWPLNAPHRVVLDSADPRPRGETVVNVRELGGRNPHKVILREGHSLTLVPPEMGCFLYKLPMK